MEKEIEELIKNNGNSNGKSSEEKIKDTAQKLGSHLKRLLKNKWKIIKINLTIAAAVVLFLLFIYKPSYESSIVILPEYGSKTPSFGNLSGLASLAGVNIGEGTPTEIYENLLLSESVLEEVIYKKYNTGEFSEPVNLVEYFDIDTDEDENPEIAERIAFINAYTDFVKSRIKTKLDKVSRILTVTINMPESKLAADVSNNLVESLDEYIRVKRKSFATEQRTYIEKRLVQVNDSLRIVENQLKNFRDKNRIVEQSPSLMLEQNRLIRNVEIQQAVFIELTKQLEIAKIDEIKDTPVVNFREEAKDSILPAGPRRAIIFVVLVFIGLIATSLYYIFSPQIFYYKNLIKQSTV